MLRKFINGLVFGTGFGVAFITIYAIGIAFILPAAIDSLNNKEPDMSGANTESVVPLTENKTPKKEFKLHIDTENERVVPVNGGMLSIAIFDEDSGKERPNSFQAWVTESKAFIISTNGEIPTIKEVPYESTEPLDFAGKLVHENVGFHKQNSTMTVSETEINRLKSGKASPRDRYLNGEFRITENDVVFLLPNTYSE